MSGPPDPHSPTGIARSQLILGFGFFVSAAILAVWLLVWLIFFQTHLRLLAFASDSVGATIPISLTFQQADARNAIARNLLGELKPLPAANPDELIPAISAYLNKNQGQTSIVYLASPALGSFGDSPDVVLAPVNVFRHIIKDKQLPGPSLRELLSVFKSARGKRLLILDIGHSRADCDPGAFADDVVAQLEHLARPPDKSETAKYAAWQREWAGLVILCSNASGQWTWTSDADGRSVFGHFLAEGLRRGGEVGDLLKSVPAQVFRWVVDHRGGAVQTPVVLGDQSVTFHIPVPTDPVADEPDPRRGDLAKTIRERLARHARRHAFYESGGLPGLDPVAWRDYRQAWLLAERFFRAGLITEAGRLLAQADTKELPFKTPADHEWPSLALSLLVNSNQDRLDPTLLHAGSAGTVGNATQPPASADGRGMRQFEDFAESQPRRFAKNFDDALESVGRPPDPSRSPLVEQALRVRRLAEKATATAPGGHRWIDSLIDAAGTQRREALDILFSDANREPVEAMLQGAEQKYSDAIKVAQALNLSQQVAADIPFLGVWLIRSQEPDRDQLIKIAEKARKLGDSFAKSRGDQSEPPVSRLTEEADALSRDFFALRTRFDTAAKLASQSESWRAIDDVLAVPLIDPALRAKLVDRSIDPTFAVALRSPAVPKTPEGESAGASLVRQGLSSGVTVQDLGRKGYDALIDRSREVALAGPAPEIRPDPSFAAHQSGLALLEWCLLTIGGCDDPAILSTLLHSTETPGGIVPAVRLARTRLLRQIPVRPGTDPVSWAAWERIRLALPTAIDDEFLGNQGSTRWRRLLMRSAEILREDGDARLAAKYLEGLPEQDQETEEVRKIAQGIESLLRPLRLDSQIDGSLVLDSGSASPVGFVVHAPNGYPHGRSALLLGTSDNLRLSAEHPHELIEIKGQVSSVPSVEIRRRDLLGQVESRALIRSALVFRGQRTVATVIPFELPVIAADFVVRFETRRLATHRTEMKTIYHIDGKDIADQFHGRQDEYFLYRGAETSFDAFLKYVPRATEAHRVARPITVSASFDGKPLTVVLKDGKDKAALLTMEEEQELTFEIGAIDTLDPRFRTLPDGSLFRFEVKAGSGSEDILLRKEIKIREINPEVNYAATAQRTAPDELAVTVRRGQNDPIAIVARVAAAVGGGQSQLRSIRYEKMTKLDKTLEDRADGGRALRREAILIHGESATFYFQVSPQENLTLKVEILNTQGRPPWPLAVTPNTIPALPAPQPDRPVRGVNPAEPAPGNPNF